MDFANKLTDVELTDLYRLFINPKAEISDVIITRKENSIKLEGSIYFPWNEGASLTDDDYEITDFNARAYHHNKAVAKAYRTWMCERFGDEYFDSLIRRCKYAFPETTPRNGKIQHNCVVDGWEDDKVEACSAEKCVSCNKFNTRYIEYPITVNEIENKAIDTYSISANVGDLVEVAPCDDEYEGKSYLGIFLGDLPIAITTSFDEEKGKLTNSTMSNPAMYVPELKKIIYGCGSWWRRIDSIEDFKGISQEDIDNTWYVKMLKALSSDKQENQL